MQIYQTKQYSTFQEALSALQAEPIFQANTPKSAAFAVAGPVIKNKCEMTNLSWTIDGHYLTKKYGVRCGPNSSLQYSLL
jgi:glucokinase